MKCPNCNVDLEATLEVATIELEIKSSSLGFYVGTPHRVDGFYLYLGTDLELHKEMMGLYTPYLSEAYAEKLLENFCKKEIKG